jgi:hypothetical protein
MCVRVRVLFEVPVLELVRGTVWRVGVCGQPKLDWGDLWVGYMGSDAKILVRPASGDARGRRTNGSYLRRPSLYVRSA